jgi:ABC-type nitrate/sulfonate/bicarbonate transport system permease component
MFFPSACKIWHSLGEKFVKGACMSRAGIIAWQSLIGVTLLGLALGRSDRLTAIFQPFIVAANSVPRIALAPIIIPSTMAWLFASLTPAISFALIGVILGEFIGAQQGIGRMIIEAEARGEAAGMMVAVFVLMVVGVVLAGIVRRVQAYLLRWRPQTVGNL